MITAEMLRIYQRYHGDADGYARHRNSTGWFAINDDDWTEIDRLWQRLAMEANVPVSASFRSETDQLLAKHVAGQATRDLFKALAT